MVNSKALSMQIVADLLSLRDVSKAGDAVNRRLGHLPNAQIPLVVAEVSGGLLYVIDQVRRHSQTGAQVIDGIRAGLIADLSVSALKTTGEG